MVTAAAICTVAIGGTLYVVAAAAMVMATLWRETRHGVAFSLERARDVITVDPIMIAGSARSRRAAS